MGSTSGRGNEETKIDSKRFEFYCTEVTSSDTLTVPAGFEGSLLQYLNSEDLYYIIPQFEIELKFITILVA